MRWVSLSYARALVDGLGFGDDAVRAHLAGLRHLGPHHHEVVELQEVVVVEHHAERARGGVLRAEDPSDVVVAHDASIAIAGRMTACRSARYTSPRSPMRWRSSRSSAPIGTRFCGARGSTCGSLATRGSTAAVRSAIAAASSRARWPGGLASHDAGPRVAALQHREPQVPGVAGVGRLRRRCRTAACAARARAPRSRRCAAARGRSPGGSSRSRRSGAPGSSSAARRPRRRTSAASSSAHSPSASRIFECRAIVSRFGSSPGALVVPTPGSRSTGGHLLPAAAGEHGPSFDADVGRPRSDAPRDPRRPRRPRTFRRAPASARLAGSSSVSRASMRRTPSTNAMRSTPSSTAFDRGPVVGLDARCRRSPSAGERASSWSSGVP